MRLGRAGGRGGRVVASGAARGELAFEGATEGDVLAVGELVHGVVGAFVLFSAAGLVFVVGVFAFVDDSEALGFLDEGFFVGVA